MTTLDVRQTIPADLLALVESRRVIEASFGAGPSFCAGKHDPFDPPVSLDEGLAWIQRYFHVMRIGSLYLDDRTVITFEPPTGFLTYDATPRRACPTPGVTVDHPDE
jgi:hypothetical protein